MIGAGKLLDKAKFIYMSEELEKCICLEKLKFRIRNTSGKIENIMESDRI